MDKNILDSYGLVTENQFIVVYIPARITALVFRVKSRVNKGYEVLNYGSLPLIAGEVIPTYEGGSITVPADGVMPARSYIPTGRSFSLHGAFDESDMWYTHEDDRNRLFHVIHMVTPEFLRIDVQIPKGVTQGRFQGDRVVTGIDKEFGFTRGKVEVVHIPRLRYGYRWGNDTNLTVRTFVKFIYGEYIVEIPKDSSLIFDILTKKIQSHWITLPISVWDPAIEVALQLTYGFTGFPIYGIHERDKAIREYNDILKLIKL
ncbi:MAG: hypothetical protein QW803_12190 [Candidatus Methanomethylicia archaeon]